MTTTGFDELAIAVYHFVLQESPKVKALLNDDELYLEDNSNNYSKLQSVVDAKTAFEAFVPRLFRRTNEFQKWHNN